MKKFIVAALAGLAVTNSFAGINFLTSHSRANCIIGTNETISWDLFHRWDMQVIAYHVHGGKNISHELFSNRDVTWRAAVLHWTEGKDGGWEVYGRHYIWPKNTGRLITQDTHATNCNVKDGFWTYDYPEWAKNN